jgi:adenylylsulfate kinase
MSSRVSTNITWHRHKVTREDREALLKQRGTVLWYTGLSGSGKSTLANAVEEKLHQRGCVTYVLDGDNIRHGLNHNLGFTPEDREENIRRIGEVARLFCDAGLLVMTAFISPYKKDREQARQLVDEGRFVEVFCSATTAECEARDPKGLYKRARAGEIQDFTGISAPYEVPENPELEVATGKLSIDESVDCVIAYLQGAGIIQPK